MGEFSMYDYSVINYQFGGNNAKSLTFVKRRNRNASTNTFIKIKIKMCASIIT